MIYFKQLICSVLYFSYNLSKAVKKSVCLGGKLLDAFRRKDFEIRALDAGQEIEASDAKINPTLTSL